MPRQARIHVPGEFIHVIARGNGRRDLFTDPASRQHFLQLWLIAATRNSLLLHAFCLMTNHIHLLVQVGLTALGKTMHEVQFKYAQYLHRRYGTDGHVFQDRYKPVPCRNDAHLLTVLRYIHRNPAKHGVVDDPGEWPWSSHAAYLGAPSPLVHTGFLLSLFGKGRDAVESYRRFIGSRAAAKWPHDTPWSWADQELTLPKSQDPLTKGVHTSSEELFRFFATEIGSSVAELASSSKKASLMVARRLFIAKARAAGCTLADIARTLKRSKSTIHYAAGEFEPNSNEGTVPLFFR